jgi:drug/metabolite transporter (DMT)-like permease
MMYLILSMLSSAAIMVVFKLFERYRIETSDAIVVNYAVAASLSFLLDPSGISLGEANHEPWFINALIMGVLFISLFNVIGISTQRIGVSVTTVANKMSLVIPVLYAILFLGETWGIFKIVGLIVALIAVLLSTRNNTKQQIDRRYVSFPFIVFLGSGFIDAFFKYNQMHTLGKNGLEPFTGWIFLTAGAIGLTVWLFNFFVKKKTPATNAFAGGLMLGIPNYFSVYFLLKALSMDGFESSVIIPVNNMAIVALGAIAGVLMFREKLSRTNYIGVALCFIAILLIGISE